jgi:hypothetical protein
MAKQREAIAQAKELDVYRRELARATEFLSSANLRVGVTNGEARQATMAVQAVRVSGETKFAQVWVSRN